MQQKGPHNKVLIAILFFTFAGTFGIAFPFFKWTLLPKVSGCEKDSPLLSVTEKDPTANPLTPHIIMLDPGHGGVDSGAAELVREVDVCENTVDSLFELLEKDPNYLPLRTRPNGEDKAIRDRVKAADEAKAEVLLSIHANCDDSTQQSHGFECFPKPPGRTYSEESLQIASYIAEGMKNAGHRLRGENGIRFAYYNGKRKIIVDSTDTRVRTLKTFGIIEKVSCPAVLIEQCFLTNRKDVNTWTGEEGCKRAACIYYEAICRYFDTVPITQSADNTLT